ncbi:MAG: YfbU family protein [Chloroflexi bacterium]|nr:YfbU family protein [Chloroflexota bacterium]MCI0853839.1 YfbU family protein [Chloroflexota bacterium]
MELTRAERWILVNQMRILENLYPDEAEHLATTRTILERGYELHYGEQAQDIYERTLTEQESREVIDIMSMYERMNWAYESLEDDDKAAIDKGDIKFRGFDGNSGSGRLEYAQFYAEEMDRFKDLERPHDFNSHSSVIDMYRRMLEEWEASGNKWELTKEDIERIIAAQTHPSNR